VIVEDPKVLPEAVGLESRACIPVEQPDRKRRSGKTRLAIDQDLEHIVTKERG
jgi:hypothetical protein